MCRIALLENVHLYRIKYVVNLLLTRSSHSTDLSPADTVWIIDSAEKLYVIYPVDAVDQFSVRQNADQSSMKYCVIQ